MSVLRSNCSVIWVVPSTLVEVICDRPGSIWPNSVSSGVATVDGHRLRTGAGILRGHRQGRELDVRQRRHRQQREGDQTGQEDRGRQQRRGDRPSDEGRRNAHRGGVLGMQSRCASCGRAGGRRHDSAVVECVGRARPACPARGATGRRRPHLWPPCSPFVTTDVARVLIANLDGLRLHGVVRLDRIDEQPVRPCWIAATGTVTALCSVSTCSRALTNSPGQRRSSSLANVALSWIVPVVVSIALFGVSNVRRRRASALSSLL